MSTPEITSEGVSASQGALEQQEEEKKSSTEVAQQAFVSATEEVTLAGETGGPALRAEVRGLHEQRLPILSEYAQAYLSSKSDADGEAFEKVAKEQNDAMEAMYLRLVDEISSHQLDEEIEIRMLNESMEFRSDEDSNIKTLQDVTRIVVRSMGDVDLQGILAGAGIQDSGLTANLEAPNMDAKLTPELRAQAGRVAQASLAEDTNTMQTEMADYTRAVYMHTGAGGFDVNALVMQVLREAYLENTQDLQFFADKVRFFNETKKVIREEIRRVNKAMQDGGEVTRVTIDAKTVVYDEEGNPRPQVTQGGKISGTQALEDYRDSLEQDLNSVGDDAQLANVDLQNMLQKQQQTLQMMSNISKMLHDTAMAVIRKIGT